MFTVIFEIWARADVDETAYGDAFGEMVALVSDVPGFISIKGYAGEDGSELAVAKFETEEAIAAWRDHPDHVRTRDRGRNEFFDAYEITIAQVARGYHWTRGEPVPDFFGSV